MLVAVLGLLRACRRTEGQKDFIRNDNTSENEATYDGNKHRSEKGKDSLEEGRII
jgi:hypothetical protein